MQDTERHSMLSDEELGKLFSPTQQDFIDRDRRACDCELTYVHRKMHGALGAGIDIKLCCLAKKVEELAGLPPGTFFFAMDFEPSWEWDCDYVHKAERHMPDGSVVVAETKRGAPPRWLLKRMQDKGVPIHNLPDDDA